MNAFQHRLDDATRLEQLFIKSFNIYCQQYKIVKYGIESTKLSEAHEFIRLCRDDTSCFLRYIPASVLVNVGDRTISNTTLIEFKAATNGLSRCNVTV
jgi:hypothetical protein